MTWGALVTAFLDSRRERSASPRTVAAYGEDLAIFARWYAAGHGLALAPDLVTPIDVAGYRGWLAERNRPATANRRLSTVHSMFTWAAGQGLLPRNPAEHLRRMPAVVLGPRALDRAQLAALVDAAGQRSRRDAVLIVVLAQTGLRISEALGLTWADVSLTREGGAVTVRRGKGDKYREVPLNATARRALTVWRDLQGPQGTPGRGPVFTAPGGRPLAIRSAQDALARHSRAAGIHPRVSPHTLRHTFCKALVDAGESLDRVAALAGHARLDTTARYTRPTRADLERAVGRLDMLPRRGASGPDTEAR